jgi:hypothetical protein
VVSRGPRATPIGVPQGAPISPILSLIALEETIFGKRKLKEKYANDSEFEMLEHSSPCFTYPFRMDAVMYADDGIKYGTGFPSHPIQGMGALKQHEAFYEVCSSAGITFHGEKSGWVKRAGRWLKPLKFLGMVYDPFREVFYSSTRKGNSLEFTESESFLS